MRVISGAARGRKLKLDQTSGIRPTSDRLKEALFSTLGPGIQGMRVLDLFAGSGALGIEALSRGAEHATFVDSNKLAVAMITANLESTQLGNRARVLNITAENFGRSTREKDEYDLVFLDPPYADGFPTQALEGLLHAGRLAPGATVVAEVSSRLAAFELPAGYRLDSERKYGDSKLLYLSCAEGG